MKFSVDSDVKQEYIDSKPENTAITIGITLAATDKYEAMIGKSVYDMNYGEIDELIKMQFPNSTANAVRKNISVLRSYIDFCIKRNLVIHGENRLLVFPSKDVMKYVNIRTMLNKFIDRETLNEYRSILFNNQDKLILELAYLGVGGKKHEEISNLTIDDIDEEKNMIVLTTNDGEHRVLKVESSLIKLIKKTYEDDIYVANNGKDMKSKNEPISFEVNNVKMYVLRVPGKKVFRRFTASTLSARMKCFKWWFGNPHLTYTSLRDSGMYQLAIDIRDEKGEITIDDFREICDKYNYGIKDSDCYGNNFRARFNDLMSAINK